jgi:hypothetical protein
MKNGEFPIFSTSLSKCLPSRVEHGNDMGTNPFSPVSTTTIHHDAIWRTWRVTLWEVKSANTLGSQWSVINDVHTCIHIYIYIYNYIRIFTIKQQLKKCGHPRLGRRILNTCFSLDLFLSPNTQAKKVRIYIYIHYIYIWMCIYTYIRPILFARFAKACGHLFF